MINFIHLKKGGKSNRKEVKATSALKPLLSSTLPRSAPFLLSKTRCKDLIPLLPPAVGGGFHFPMCKKHKVKKPIWSKSKFPQEWLRWSMTSPISIKGCVSSTTFLNEPLPLWNMNPSEGWKCFGLQHPKEKRLFDRILCLSPKPGLSSVTSVSQNLTYGFRNPRRRQHNGENREGS